MPANRKIFSGFFREHLREHSREHSRETVSEKVSRPLRAAGAKSPRAITRRGFYIRMENYSASVSVSVSGITGSSVRAATYWNTLESSAIPSVTNLSLKLVPSEFSKA